MSNITINLKSIFYEDKEMQDIMKNFCLIKRNLIKFLKTKISFSVVRARTFIRTFDRGFVRGEYKDLKFCRRIFYYAAGRSEMCMIFLLVEWKK